MTDAAIETADETPHPARFMQRVGAMIIDEIVVTLALGIVALLLFQPTHGAVRVSTVYPIHERSCSESSVSVARSTPSLPSESRTSRAATCVSTAFGFVHDRVRELSEETRTGSVTRTWTTRLPLDAAGDVTRALYLDDIVVLAFVLAAYLLVLETWFGTTLGKRMLGIRIRSAGNKPTFAAVFKRLLILFLPFVPLVPLLVIALAMHPADPFLQSDGYWYAAVALWAVSLIGTAAILVNLLRASMNGDLPWHDRWAGTEAVTRR